MTLAYKSRRLIVASRPCVGCGEMHLPGTEAIQLVRRRSWVSTDDGPTSKTIGWLCLKCWHAVEQALVMARGRA